MLFMQGMRQKSTKIELAYLTAIHFPLFQYSNVLFIWVSALPKSQCEVDPLSWLCDLSLAVSISHLSIHTDRSRDGPLISARIIVNPGVSADAMGIK
jgi:hypothetical protein